MVERSGDKLIARKICNRGQVLQRGIIEIKTGLTGGDLIITEGYQTVYDGQSVATLVNKVFVARVN